MEVYIKMMPDYIKLWLFISSFVASMVATVFLSKILRPSNPNPTKKSTYECGQSPFGDAHDFMLTGILHYFIYAIIFFIFDLILWILISYSVVIVTAETSLSFFGFLAYLSVVFIALAYFLSFLERSKKWQKRRRVSNKGDKD